MADDKTPKHSKLIATLCDLLQGIGRADRRPMIHRVYGPGETPPGSVIVGLVLVIVFQLAIGAIGVMSSSNKADFIISGLFMGAFILMALFIFGSLSGKQIVSFNGLFTGTVVVVISLGLVELVTTVPNGPRAFLLLIPICMGVWILVKRRGSR